MMRLRIVGLECEKQVHQQLAIFATILDNESLHSFLFEGLVLECFTLSQFAHWYIYLLFK